MLNYEFKKDNFKASMILQKEVRLFHSSVEGISKSVYGKNLDPNLAKLADKIQSGAYRQRPKREILPSEIGTPQGSIMSPILAKITGHVNYYGYHDNQLKLLYFVFKATGSLFKWLNRRGQKRSYNWDGLKEKVKNFPLIKEIKLKQLGWNPYAY